MAKRGIRVMLWVVIVAAAAITAYFFWLDETATRKDASAAHAFDDSAHAAARALMDLRAAQQAYVATGQGSDFWGTKVSEAFAAARLAVGRMRVARSSAAQSAIQDASSTLDDFEQMDRRAREYVASGQLLMASDVIFSAGLELTDAAWSDVQQAWAAEQQTADAMARSIRLRQWVTLAAGAGATTLLALLLVPVPRAEAQAEIAAPVSPAASVTRDEELDLHVVERKASRPKAPATAAPPPAAATEPAAAAALGAQRDVDLDAIASVCADLARVTDTRALPQILERAAVVLDAAGIVLWIADPDGRELAPIVAHGYSPQLVTRLGTIARDAENVTAAAFRTALMQTVKGDAVSNGAIAAPLVTPSGCVGVMAAEVRNGGEVNAARLATATIVAAQLATLAGPPVSRKAEAAGG